MMGACLALAGGVDSGGRPRVVRSATVSRGTSVEVPAGRLSARWLGQDGRDLVGPSAEPKPNDVQDIHILLGGLAPRREVASVTVTGHGQHQWRMGTPQGPWGL